MPKRASLHYSVQLRVKRIVLPQLRRSQKRVRGAYKECQQERQRKPYRTRVFDQSFPAGVLFPRSQQVCAGHLKKHQYAYIFSAGGKARCRACPYIISRAARAVCFNREID